MKLTENQNIAAGMAIGIVIGAALGILFSTARGWYLGRHFAETQARVIEFKTDEAGEMTGPGGIPHPLWQTRLKLEYGVNGTNIQAELVTPRSVGVSRPVAIWYRKSNPRECIIKD